MQRLKLEHGRELRSPAQLVRDDMGGDLGGKRQRESHKNEDSNKGGRSVNVRGVLVPSSFALSWTERKANRGSRLPNFLPQMLKREALRSTVSLFPVLKRAWGNLEFARRQHLGKLVALPPRSQLLRQQLATRDVRHSASYDVRHSDSYAGSPKYSEAFRHSDSYTSVTYVMSTVG